NPGWNHLAWAYNLATPVAYLYINGADAEVAGSTETDDTIDYTVTNHGIGGRPDVAGSLLNADLADVLIAFGEFFDISNSANLLKLRSAAGKPLNLGANGATPSGSQPIMFFRRAPGAAASTFATNLGGGGDFTITGALTNATTSPSD
ncbi:MAG: hypothetical protein NUW01_18460, partial [Gemmatimonadaceae bacterium]|nr:hypothetical protein [Gemmatimonadaceae bacterium]